MSCLITAHEAGCTYRAIIAIHSLVLENLSFPFLKPNILDVKLGTVLYDEDASPEKKERMDKAARDTTTHETGVRLTGFQVRHAIVSVRFGLIPGTIQVYDSKTGTAVATPKAYGKSIKAKDLPDGMARFFPLAEGDSTLGLPRNLLLPIVRGVRKNVAEIRDALAGVELRMVGGSILVIYEGDPTRAEETLKALKEDKMDGEEDDDDDDDEEKPKLGPPYLVKLIDFAHAKFTPGQGPDEGVLKGLDTVLGLLDGRIKSIADN